MKYLLGTIIVFIILFFTFARIKAQDPHTAVTKAYNEWSYTFFIWQGMHAKRQGGVIDYQEMLQWNRVRKAWERFDKAVMREYEQ